MGKDTKIEWAKHTFNAWIGCQPVGPECDNRYAETQNKFRHWVDGWGPHGERRRTSESNWKNPLKWNRAAEAAGEVHTVFANSLSDVFDNQAPEGARASLFDLIQKTPNLLWLLLTKRPQNIIRMVKAEGAVAGNGTLYLPKNVALGTSAGNQKQAELMVPHLLRAKAELGPAFAFVSAEPLLGLIDFRKIKPDATMTIDALTGDAEHLLGFRDRAPRLDWIIAGGESGHGARPSNPQWFRDIRDQCAAAGVAFHFKQWGEFGPNVLGVNDSMPVTRLGKKAAGRLLDGRTHDEFPTPSRRNP